MRTLEDRMRDAVLDGPERALADRNALNALRHAKGRFDVVRAVTLLEAIEATGRATPTKVETRAAVETREG